MDPAVLFFFEKDPAALPLYEAFERAVRELVPDVEIKEQKTQISYADPRVFAAESFPPCETEFLEQESEVKCVNYPIS